ncbi:FCD domain-containing protein [Azospirillum sp.]|uniref:FCD domain-containing protein n=1 Tax=Azospirillum sp. TaxID=34012 RepID=UPI002D47C297|nr:FCD domain-containing protein [Azospirillum sp.]HYD68576.1 FCD domain-containing protein [Azospirillum sp.]
MDDQGIGGAVSTSPDPLDEERRNARTLVEFAYGRLRREILCGHLEPGSRLRVEQLKTEYQVGSSTLREALSLLVADALVTSEGQKGFRVAPISLEDLRDVTEMRKLLETRALKEAIALGDDNWEAGVVAAYHRLTRVEERLGDGPEPVAEEWEERNRAFHEALIAACPSKWLRHFRSILYHQSERYRRLALTARAMPRDVHAEHQGIMEAVLARDVETATRLTEEHIDRTLAAVTQLAGNLKALKPK